MVKTSKLDRNSHFTVNMIFKHAPPHTQYAIKINQIKKKKDGVKAMSVCVCACVFVWTAHTHSAALECVSANTMEHKHTTISNNTGAGGRTKRQEF